VIKSNTTATWVVLVTVGLVASSCAGGSGASGDPDSKPVEVVVSVTPEEPFIAELPGVAVVEGRAGSVSRPGEITLRAADDPPDDEGLAAGPGVDVQFSDTEPTTALTLRMPAPPEVADASPIVIHELADDRWDLETVEIDADGHFVIETAEFSSFWPSWLNPIDYLKGPLDSIADLLTGRTDPRPCQGGGPDWAELDNRSTLVHTCLITNSTGDGKDRAEAQLQSNRSFWMKVSASSASSDYVWLEGADSLLGKALNRHFPLGHDEYLLAPNTQLTTGYFRPYVDKDEALTSYLDLSTAALSLGLSTLSIFAIDDDRSGLAALYALITCGDSIPGSVADAEGLWEFFVCMLTDALPSLDDPDTAAAAAVDLLGDVPDMEVDRAARALDDAAGRLRLLGSVVKLLGAFVLVKDIFQQIPDAFSQAVDSDSGDVVLYLTGRPPPDVEDLLLTVNGMDTLRIGMTEAELAESGLARFNIGACPTDLHGEGAPDGIWQPIEKYTSDDYSQWAFHLEQPDRNEGLLTRIAVWSPSPISTDRNVRTGDSLADLEAAYAGELRELDEPDYDNLRQFVHEDGERALLFDVANHATGDWQVWGIAATTLSDEYYTYWESEGPESC
jgi:hypothetical protein